MEITRRQWIAGGAASVAAFAAGGAIAQVAARQPIGIQLYTVRELFAKDPAGTLEKIAHIGYREVEYGGGGYDAMDHAMLRRTTDRLGLTAPSIHVPYEAMTGKFDASVKMAKALGADTIVVPFMEQSNREPAAWRKAVGEFNRIAARLRTVGLGFAYHNHDFEFTTKAGSGNLYDILLAERDPKLVKLELDLFWAIAAGQDPKALIRRAAGTVYAYHVKDRTAAGKMTSVGAGTIDFADIFTLNATAGVKHFYVENDQSPAPYLPDITASFAALSKLRK